MPPGAKKSPSKPSVFLNLHITNFILKHVRQVVFNLKLCSINCVLGFSGGSEQKKKKNLLVNAGDRSWIPDLGRPHMPGEQGSPEVATAQPALYRRAAAAIEPTCGITEAHMPWGLGSATREATKRRPGLATRVTPAPASREKPRSNRRRSTNKIFLKRNCVPSPILNRIEMKSQLCNL